jgi:hypothetical protein
MRTMLLALIWLLTSALPVEAAVGFDSFGQTTHTGSAASSVAVSITVGTGNVLVVIVGLETTTTTVTSITGAGATWSGSAFSTFTGFYRWEAWSGTTPSTGAQTVTVNLSASVSTDIIAYVWSFTGVKTAAPLANWTTASGVGNAGNQVAITTVSGDGAASGTMDGTSLTAVSGCTTTLDVAIISLDNKTTAAHCLAAGASTSVMFNSTGSSDTVGIDVVQFSGGPAFQYWEIRR